jgi:general stress protein YciG
MEEKKKRGFAVMDPELRRAICSKGGKAAHAPGGKGHEFTKEEAQAAGRKGGLAVSRNKQHMRDIGRKGGEMRTSNSGGS